MNKKPKWRKRPKAVALAEENFMEAEDTLKEFKENNSEFMEQLVNLVANRERARERLLAAVSTHRVGAGGMTVRISTPRTFHAQRLYEHLPEAIRDKVVSVRYKVNTKAFDNAVERGQIDNEIVEIAFEEGEQKISIGKKIQPINLG